jgi:hypothetical protein
MKGERLRRKRVRYGAPVGWHRARILILGVPVAVSLGLAAPAAAGESRSDKAILKAGVITKEDVPADWTSKRGETGGRALRGISECKKINAAVEAAKKKEPRARSREFQDPVSQGTTSAENAVYAFKDESAATRFMATYQGTDADACFDKAAAKVASEQPTAETPSVAPITDLQGVGDEAIGYEIVVTFAQDDQSFTLYLDIVAVRVGRTVLGFNFSNIGSRITQGPDIVNAVVDRVAAVEA